MRSLENYLSEDERSQLRKAIKSPGAIAVVGCALATAYALGKLWG